jgi:hypothetical protein
MPELRHSIGGQIDAARSDEADWDTCSTSGAGCCCTASRAFVFSRLHSSLISSHHNYISSSSGDRMTARGTVRASINVDWERAERSGRLAAAKRPTITISARRTTARMGH